MEPKKQALLVAAIAVTIIAGVIASFGLPLFAPTPSIVLPNVNTDPGGNNSALTPGEDENYVWVMVTTETVQDVIATLHRKDSYYRQVTVELWGKDTQTPTSSSTFLVWADSGYMKTATMLPDGVLQNCLFAEGKKYLWYGNDRTWHEDDMTAWDSELVARLPDLAYSIPTYEDVLKLDPASIVEADYRTYLAQNCIYVKCSFEELDALEHYWISTENGLLIAAVREEGGVLKYRMAQNQLTDLSANMTEFALPNGTVLHTVVPIGAQAEEED